MFCGTNVISSLTPLRQQVTNCDQVIHLFTAMCLNEEYGGGGAGVGPEGILQTVVWSPRGATSHHLTPGCVGLNWREMSPF